MARPTARGEVIGSGGHGFLHVRHPRLGGLPIGNLDQQVGVIEHLVARAAEESMLVRSLRCDHVFEQALQLISPTGPGPQLDDHFDCHPAILLHVPQHTVAGRTNRPADRPALDSLSLGRLPAIHGTRGGANLK